MLKDKQKERVVYNYLILCFLAVFCLFSTRLVYGPTTLLGDVLSILAISCLISCGSLVIIPTKMSSISRIVSLRSYSLYAIHWPIIKSVQEISNPSTILSWSVYLIVSILFVGVATEILYQLVEKPAISAGKRLRIRNYT